MTITTATLAERSYDDKRLIALGLMRQETTADGQLRISPTTLAKKELRWLLLHNNNLEFWYGVLSLAAVMPDVVKECAL